MRDPIVSTDALYDVAMAVGTSLDLKRTLCTALQAIVRAFDCNAGIIMLAEWDNERLATLNYECVFPPDAENLPSCRQAADIALSMLQGQTRQSLALLSPRQEQLDGNNLIYLFPLPRYGVLILDKHDTPISSQKINALNPILHKMEQAIEHALRFQQIKQALAELEVRHRTTTEMVDDFLAAVSHELRTPLTLIMGFIETLLDGRPGPLTETQRRFLQNSYGSSSRMLELVDNLLTVTYLQQGHIKLDKRLLNPQHFLESLREKISEAAAQRQLTVFIDNDWNTAGVCLGDQHWLEQVVFHLMSNAVKFSPPDEPIYIESHPQSGQWVFKITDTGSGVPETELPYVFDRFYRGQNAKTAQMHGVGVGLCVCKTIIEAHGGNVGIKNNPQGGVTAWFTLPLEEVT